MGFTDLYKISVNTMGLSATTLVISAFGAFAQDAAKPVTPAAKATTAAPAAAATATKKAEVKKSHPCQSESQESCFTCSDLKDYLNRQAS